MNAPAIAYFITPHGFGHAARAAAVMAEIHRLASSACFEIFTQVPDWFFHDSLTGQFHYHPLETDIGLVQNTPFEHDLDRTIDRLDAFFPFDDSEIRGLAEKLQKLKCELVLCDIAAMGISVARAAGIPSVLTENFTWDWIYEEYANADQRIHKHIERLQTIYRSADYHIQPEPVCVRDSHADLTTHPIGRSNRLPARQVRQALGIPDDARMALITMGGIPGGCYEFLQKLHEFKDTHFFIAGAIPDSNPVDRQDNVILLSQNSGMYHPDMIHASDLVIGKAGYSTVAEVYYAGIPFVDVYRNNFRESAVLTDFIRRHIPGISVPESEFQEGSWLSHLNELLDMPRVERNGAVGANEAARFVCNLLKK